MVVWIAGIPSYLGVAHESEKKKHQLAGWNIPSTFTNFVWYANNSGGLDQGKICKKNPTARVMKESDLFEMVKWPFKRSQSTPPKFNIAPEKWWLKH